jgi:hypothetical protein
VLIIFQGIAQAESRVAANCASTSSGSSPSAFGTFSTEAQRRADPVSYVQAMDRMISSGPFKSLLDCRDRLKADPQFRYNLRFLRENEDGTMLVRRTRQNEGSGARVSIELLFNLKGSPQKIFFVYIHELTHVCQDYRWADLQAKFDLIELLPQNFMGGMGMMMAPPSNAGCEGLQKYPDAHRATSNSEIRADYVRHRKLGEVEAFYAMTRAYQHYTGVDPSFCRDGKEDKNSNMYEGYLEMERMIDQGFFAQDIIVKYHEEDGNKEETASALYDLNSPQRLYPDKVLRPTLNPAMRDLIREAGMPVIEPMQKSH